MHIEKNIKIAAFCFAAGIIACVALFLAPPWLLVLGGVLILMAEISFFAWMKFRDNSPNYNFEKFKKLITEYTELCVQSESEIEILNEVKESEYNKTKSLISFLNASIDYSEQQRSDRARPPVLNLISSAKKIEAMKKIEVLKEMAKNYPKLPDKPNNAEVRACIQAVKAHHAKFCFLFSNEIETLQIARLETVKKLEEDFTKKLCNAFIVSQRDMPQPLNSSIRPEVYTELFSKETSRSRGMRRNIKI